MSFRLDDHGNAVTEPFKSISEFSQWIPNAFPSNSSNKELTGVKHTILPVKCKARPSRPQVLVCHDMYGGYLEDRFNLGCSEATAYRFYHWQFIDIFIYFSHHFITIPPVGWIKAAKKHGVTILGTIITEWDEGTEICKELLKSEETIDQFTTKLVQLALFHGFNGWLINIENKLETGDVPQLEKFVQQLTAKCHDLLGVSKVLWYDSVISTGELKWQDELNSLNKMFFTVSDGIFLNYNITEEKLSRSKQVASACGREFDVFVGIDVFGRGTPGGGGFNTIEAFKMIRNHGLSCALFATGWVYEHLGHKQFDLNELMFWGILSETLTPRPIEVPFATSFCRGYGDRYYIQGQILSDLPWYNLSLQQVQPSFTQSQFVSYKVTKIKEPEKDNQQKEEQEKFRVEVESSENNMACPKMTFNISVGYFGGGCLRLSAKRHESVPVLFRLFVLQVQSEKSYRVSMTWNIPADSSCLAGIVLSASSAHEPEKWSTVICTETELSDKQREMLQKMLSEPDDLSLNKCLPVSVHFVLGTIEERVFSEDKIWVTCVFNVDLRELSREVNQSQEIIMSAVLIPSAELKDGAEVHSQMCVHIGYLQILEATDLIEEKQKLSVKNFKCLEVKADSLLSKENINQIQMHPFFGSDDRHLDDMKEVSCNPCHEKENTQMDAESKAQEENHSLDRKNATLNYSIPLVVSRQSLDLTSTTSALAVTSTDIPYNLYLLKWETLADNVDAYLMYCYDESGVKRFIGLAVENWFVWKVQCKEKKVTKFSIQPIISRSNLVAEEICFCM